MSRVWSLVKLASTACEEDSCWSAATIMQCNTQGAQPCRVGRIMPRQGLATTRTRNRRIVSIPLLKYSPLSQLAQVLLHPATAMMRGGTRTGTSLHLHLYCTYTASVLLHWWRGCQYLLRNYATDDLHHLHPWRAVPRLLN